MTLVTDTIRNGVDAEKMFGTLDLIKDQPELARFQFRARNRWIGGAHNRSTIQGFYAAGGEDTSRTKAFQIDAGEPAILLGTDTGANPAEYLLHALAACLTTSIVYVAAARKVRLASVESTLTGDMDVRGALGVDDEPRNGFERIGVAFRVAGDAPAENCATSWSVPRRVPRSTTWSPTACRSPWRSAPTRPRAPRPRPSAGAAEPTGGANDADRTDTAHRRRRAPGGAGRGARGHAGGARRRARP